MKSKVKELDGKFEYPFVISLSVGIDMYVMILYKCQKTFLPLLPIEALD